ncbi:hypothetical protein [Dactylosporangium sp. NPDC005555]|uniref:hypothetical protein n=1 Tax=Dactylosporangium sp. NPDC005555 TaxID=3154889 RepID=UPI0033B88CC8
MPRSPRTAVVVGPTLVGLAVIGLSILLYASYVGIRDAHVVRHLYTTLTADALVFMVPAILLMAGLLTGSVLVLARRDAGRSALVWLCGTGTVVALLLYLAHMSLLRNRDFDVWIGPPEWIGTIGGLLAVGRA